MALRYLYLYDDDQPQLGWFKDNDAKLPLISLADANDTINRGIVNADTNIANLRKAIANSYYAQDKTQYLNSSYYVLETDKRWKRLM